MASPSDCRYTESHEWLRLDGDVVTIGVTQFAADELTDITFVELKPVSTALAPGDNIGELESVKTTADVYAAVGGEIIEVNEAVVEDPSLINASPFEDGWLVKIRTKDTGPLEDLMDQETYDEKHPVSG